MIFKNYMKILKKHIKMTLFSFIMFTVMLIIFTSQKNVITEFKSIKLNLTINDKDKSKESKNFINYLKEKHNIKEEDITEKEAKKQIVEDKIIAYIEIKKDFKENLLKGEKPISVLIQKDVPDITFLKIDLEKYLNYTLAGMKSNINQKEINDTLKKEINVKIIDISLYNSEKAKQIYFTTFSILSYIVFMGVVSVIINIDAEFKKESILKRISLSPYSQKSQVFQQFLAQMIIAISISTIYLLITIYKTNSAMTINELIYISLSTYIFSFTSISIGQLLISISKDVKVINSINSAFSLIMCFSSGVFIPMKFLPKQLVLFSKFMPQYYFVKFLEKINLNNFINFTIYQIIFILFYTLLAIFIKKHKLKEVS